MNATISVRVSWGDTIDPRTARSLLDLGAASLARHGLRLDATDAPGGPWEAAVADGTPATALAPAARVLAATASPGAPRGAVAVVVLPHVVSPRSALAGGGALRALTLTPDDPPSGLEAPNDWDPLVILGRDELQALDPPQRGAIVAHEIGHALGLVHVENPENLMNPATPTCLGALRADQRDRLSRPLPRAGWFAWITAFTLGCIGEDTDQDPTDDPGPPACVDTTTATVEVGLGTTQFAAVAADGPAPLEAGPQGGYHVWGALRATGIDPGPGTFVSADNPWVSFEIVQDDATIGGYAELQRPFITTAGGADLLGQQLVLTHPNPPDLYGQPARLRAMVVDKDGRCAEAEVAVTLSQTVSDGG